MAKNFEKLIFGGLHEKHAVQRGSSVLPQSVGPLGRRKPRRKTTTSTQDSTDVG
jgi:hypothetical protein